MSLVFWCFHKPLCFIKKFQESLFAILYFQVHVSIQALKVTYFFHFLKGLRWMFFFWLLFMIKLKFHPLSVEKEWTFLPCGLSLSFDKIIVVLRVVNVFFMVCDLHQKHFRHGLQCSSFSPLFKLQPTRKAKKFNSHGKNSKNKVACCKF